MGPSNQESLSQDKDPAGRSQLTAQPRDDNNTHRSGVDSWDNSIPFICIMRFYNWAALYFTTQQLKSCLDAVFHWNEWNVLAASHFLLTLANLNWYFKLVFSSSDWISKKSTDMIGIGEKTHPSGPILNSNKRIQHVWSSTLMIPKLIDVFSSDPQPYISHAIVLYWTGPGAMYKHNLLLRIQN